MRLAAALTLVLAATLSADARAALVSVSFGGVWDEVDDTTGALTVGSSFTATMIFDDSVSDESPEYPDEGIYDVSSSFGFVLQTGPYTFSRTGNGRAEIFLQDADPDLSLWGAEGFAGGPNLPIFAADSRVSFSASDASGTALSSDLLTEVPWDLSAWSGGGGFLDMMGVDGTTIFLRGTITSMSVVPEPTTALLVATGAVALAARRRFRCAA